MQTVRADTVTFAARSNESHQTVKLSGQRRDETRTVPAGSLFVPIAQPKARLVMAMLEPQAPDSLLQWGFSLPRSSVRNTWKPMSPKKWRATCLPKMTH